MTSYITLSDEKLYRLCREYGEQARFWKRKFAGLLPEVFRRHLYRKKGFQSIFEFAAKLAGMSHEQVRLVLNLDKKFGDKPILKSLLIEGEVSANKLVRIASIATPENQEALARWTQTLSTRALETLVRDEKRSSMAEQESNREPVSISANKNQAGLQEALFGDESLHVHSKTYDIGVAVKIVEKLTPEVQGKLLELINKNIDINGIIEKALQDREENIEMEKSKISHELAKNAITPYAQADDHKRPTRHIPARVIKVLNAEQGDKCSVPTCNNPAAEIHHELPFAMTKAHDPYNLKKLCKAHHEIAHAINIKFFYAKTAALDTG